MEVLWLLVAISGVFWAAQELSKSSVDVGRYFRCAFGSWELFGSSMDVVSYLRCVFNYLKCVLGS